MKVDIFGKPVIEKTATVLVFHDERRFRKEWLYHGLLVVPHESFEEVFKNLSDCRERSNYYKKLHFCEMTEEKYSKRILLAREWIKYFRSEFFNYGFLYFFGVFLRNINYDLFGDYDDKRSQKDYRIYNRFFEMALFSMLRFFFKDYDSVTVSHIFSHASERPEEDPFPQHSIYKINQREVENIRIQAETVTQISADYQKEKEHNNECHFIQFIDNVIGAIGQVLDCSSERACFLELGGMMLPLVEAMTKDPYNIRSKHYKRYALSFFPKKFLQEDEIYSQPRKNLFFHGRELKLLTKNQMELPF